MLLKELIAMNEAKDQSQARVDFVQGWADLYLEDQPTIEDLEKDFWSMLEDDDEKMAEAKKIGLTKKIAYDILETIADDNDLFHKYRDDSEDEDHDD